MSELKAEDVVVLVRDEERRAIVEFAGGRDNSGSVCVGGYRRLPASEVAELLAAREEVETLRNERDELLEERKAIARDKEDWRTDCAHLKVDRDRWRELAEAGRAVRDTPTPRRVEVEELARELWIQAPVSITADVAFADAETFFAERDRRREGETPR
jgi:hypothetical protein